MPGSSRAEGWVRGGIEHRNGDVDEGTDLKEIESAKQENHAAPGVADTSSRLARRQDDWNSGSTASQRI